MRRSLTLFLLLSTAYVKSQTLAQWSQLVQWDGVSHWSRYLKTFPAYQGPNALPVPRIGNGLIDSTFFISAGGSFHFSNGDNTQNYTVYANYCLVKELIAVDIYWVPGEYYQLTHAMKEERRIYPQFYYDKKGEGELHLNANIQLLKRWKKYINLKGRMGYRFPSGSGFGAARDIDAPGYYFDLSFGKPIRRSGFTFVGMLGFYSWHIESDRNNQDDAFLFGGGLQWEKNSWRLETNLAGYIGYLEDSGDKPTVFRFNAEKRIKKFSLLFGFQQGLHDFDYSTGEIAVKYTIRR